MLNNTESELIKKFLGGDEVAFNRLVTKYQKAIYWHARRMVGNHFDADEIAQQVIIVIYNKLDTFNFNSSFKTWVYRITQTRTLNYLRKQKIKKFFSIDDSETISLNSNEDIIRNYEDKEKLENLQIILNKLPVKQREVFIFRHFDNLSYEEISQITGKSVGGLKANYFHASKKIFGMLDHE